MTGRPPWCAPWLMALSAAVLLTTVSALSVVLVATLVIIVTLAYRFGAAIGLRSD